MTVKGRSCTGSANKEITITRLRRALAYMQKHEEKAQSFPPLTEEEALIIQKVLNFSNNIKIKNGIVGTYKVVKIIKTDKRRNK